MVYLSVLSSFKKVKVPRTKKKIPQIINATKKVDTVRYKISAVLFLAFWLAFCTVTITFPGYVWMLPFHYEWHFVPRSWQVAIVLLGLMFLVDWFSPSVKTPNLDLSPFWARWGLLSALVLAVILCLYHMDMPPGNYGDDAAYNMYELRQMKDLSDYRGTFVFERGLLPFWPYVGLFLWRLLPDLSTLAVQRLTGAAFDVATIVGIYFVGKEISGRRVGLYAAAIVAVSKPFLYKIVSGYSYYVLAFSMVLVFWSNLRLLRKDARHPFLWWGILVGLEAYSSFPIQPFVVFFIFAGLVLVRWPNREKMTFKSSNWFVWLSSVLFVIDGLFCTGSFQLDKWLGINMDRVQPLMSCAFLVVAMILITAYFLKPSSISTKNLWVQWVFGAWLAVLISFPALTHRNIMERIRTHGWVQGSDYFSCSYISLALKHVPDTFQALFWQFQDRPDMSLFQDPFFSYAEMILICLGVVFCLSRPNLKRVFIVVVGAVGLTPHFFAGMNHSGLLVSCLVPLWLIASIGLDGLTEKILSLARTRTFVLIFSILLAGFWLWSAQDVFSRVYTQWADKPEDIVIVRSAALADMAQKDDRVYLSEQLFYRSADAIYDGGRFFLWNVEKNHIDLAPGEKVPNVVIYMVWNEANAIKKNISAVFPHAQWTGLGTPLEPGLTKAFRCEIPASDIEKRSSKLFTIHPVQGDFWTRTCGLPDYGLNFSGVTWQDMVANPHTASPNGIQIDNGHFGLMMDSTIHIAQSGKYQITCGTNDRTIFSIDNKKLFDMRFLQFGDSLPVRKTKKETMNLEKGDHHVKIIVYLQSDGLPDISFKLLGSGEPDKSLWSGFTF